ncbi:MAG: hypothetical protein ACYCO9_17820 [Streptosporangiaceae bacterium]
MAGYPTGETLNMTTAALPAGAASVIGGLWALPAWSFACGRCQLNRHCTGKITADCLAAVLAGVRPAEALRRARERFLADRHATVRVPGGGGAHMERAAPWAWAGLCAFG